MEIQGRVQNGVVVFDGESHLPEGAEVRVVYSGSAEGGGSGGGERVVLPLVRCREPGSVDLTPGRIAEVLDAEDAPPRR